METNTQGGSVMENSQGKEVEGLNPQEIKNVMSMRDEVSTFSLGDTSRAFESSKFSKSFATVLEKGGAKDSMTYTQGEYAYAVKNLGYSSWKMTINNPNIVALVKKDTEVQNAVLSGATPAPEEKRLKSSYEIAIERMDAKNKETSLSAPKVVEQSKLGVKQETEPTETVFKRNFDLPKEGEQAPTVQALSPQVEPKVTSPRVPRSLDDRINMSPENFVKEFGATQNLEKVGEGLEKRKEGTLKRLAGLGLTKLPGALEVFKNVKPRYKLAMGLTLAGASFATGGLTSVLSTGLSTLSYSSGFYAKILAAEQKKNPDVKKEWIAARALGYGLVAALASSTLIGHIVEYMPEGAVDAVKEKVSAVKDSLKEWFSSFTSAPPVPSLGTMPINGLTMDNGMTMNPGDAVAQVPGHVSGMLADHIIQPGESITKIIREQVLSTIPGAASMSELQKNNMIENFLKQASENKGTSYYDTINKFADPNMIQPGQKLNLTQIRDGLTGYRFNQFGGQTLLEHAKSLGEYASSPTTSVYSSPVTPDVPSALSQPYVPVNPADFGADNNPVPEVLPDAGQNSSQDATVNPSNQAGEGSDEILKENPRIQGLGYRNNA